jgi:hypothetical protein
MFSLKDVKAIRLLVDDKPTDLEALPSKGRVASLEFVFAPAASVKVPFTEIPLAAEWGKFLQQELQNLAEGKV